MLSESSSLSVDAVDPAMMRVGVNFFVYVNSFLFVLLQIKLYVGYYASLKYHQYR